MELEKHVRERIAKLLSEKPQRDPYRRFTILAYQLADVGRCMRYMDIYPDERTAYLSYLRTSLSDLLVQTIVIAELFEFSSKELIELGTQRLDEFKKKGRYSEDV